MALSTRLLIVAALIAGAPLVGQSVNDGEHTPQLGAPDDVRALLDRGLYDQAETIAQGEVEKLARASDADPRSIADASDVLVRVLTLNGKGSLPSTLALAERALVSRESLAAGTSPEHLASSLINLGTVLGETAVHPRAIALLERAVGLSQHDGIQGVALADALQALGIEFVRAGRYKEALDPLRRSLVIKEADGKGAIGLAITLNALALTWQRLGDYAAARAVLDRAVGLRPGERSHPVQVTTLTLLGQQWWFEGSWLEARDALMRAVDLGERTLRADHPETAVAMRYLAATLLDLGDVTQAKLLHERALGMAQRSLGQTHHEISAYLSGLGESTRLAGDYIGARRLYERALSIAEPKLGSRHTWVAGLLHNLALVDAHLGDYAAARQRQTRAIAIWERALGRDHPTVAVALTELAAVHRDQGSLTEATRLLERALAIRERRLGPEHRDVARTLADLSGTVMQAGQVERAQMLATRALQIFDRVDAGDAPDVANALDLYAQLQTRRGNIRVARDYFARALTIKRQVFGDSHPSFAETQARLALTLASVGDTTEALTAAQSAETTGREHLRLMLRYLPERQSLGYAATRPRGLDLILSLVGVVPAATVIGLDELIKSRALVLDEMAKRRHAVPAEDAVPLAADLARARQRLVNLAVRGPGDLSPARYAAVVDEARRDSVRAERLLVERSATFRAELDAAQIGLEHVRAELDDGTALVAFVRHERTELTRLSSPSTAYLAFVLTRAQPPISVPLGRVETIDRLVSSWRSDIEAERIRAGKPQAGVARSSWMSGTALRKLVWDPLAIHLTGKKRILIVPDGSLSLIPFYALPVGQSTYLLDEGPIIHYVSAERDLAWRKPNSTRTAGGLLALGGPAFDDRTPFRGNTTGPTAFRSTTGDCDSLQGLTFARLDGALQEVHEVSRLWSRPPQSVRVLVGAEASERAFKEEAAKYEVLHLATHGFFLEGSCERSTARIPGQRAVSGLVTASSTRAAELRRENPLMLSGLALAGANRRALARPDDDDGILTAEEVASLNLERVEWAVLSACGTGLGELKAGEGVFGLRRAFRVAGARTVIMSLWSVDDQGTRAWMRALYEGRFQKGLSTADAVHAASLNVLRDRRSKGHSTLPFYWAAFVAAGDWR